MFVIWHKRIGQGPRGIRKSEPRDDRASGNESFARGELQAHKSESSARAELQAPESASSARGELQEPEFESDTGSDFLAYWCQQTIMWGMVCSHCSSLNSKY